MKTQRWMLALGLFVVVAVAVFFYLRNRRAAPVAGPAGPQPGEGYTNGPLVYLESRPSAFTGESDGAESPSVFPLKRGSAGPEVAQLQKHLVRQYGAQFPGGITSSFDGTTEAAVVKHLKRDTISQAYYTKVGMGSPYGGYRP